MNNELKEFVHQAIFIRQVKRTDDIFHQARKSGLPVTRRTVAQCIEAVCTPYKRGRNG